MRFERREPECAQAVGEPLALLDHRRRVGLGREGGDRERRGDVGDRRGSLSCVQLLRDVCGRERVTDARPCEGEQLRERAQHDHAVVEQPGRGLAAELEVRLVDDEGPCLG